ncbi:unnamed protein product [Linum tenue]|uniref:DNA endonuclease activator Ctp1 C-terminal domain-containing protein n=1 Tax=Linum tenue TaxID=586396 RepID=A0AAV0L263_9ROSI|nr:unnamed protein product [Linum tenue]
MDQLPPKSGSLVDLDDVKHVSRLSTILVATIEEAKDRISQIEYIFCNQLYPNVQTKYKNSQEVYLEAKRRAEDGYKEKENALLLRIEELERGQQEAIAENQSLKLEKEKWLEAKKREMKSGVEAGNEQERIALLEQQLRQKSVQVEREIELSDRVIQMVQSKSSKILEQSLQLKQQEEKANGLVGKVEELERKAKELMKEIGEKNEEIDRQKDGLESKIFRERKITEEEKVKLKEKIDELKRNLNDKSREVEEGRALQEELQEQASKLAVKLSDKVLSEYSTCKEHAKVREVLEVKIRGLEEKVNELQKNNISRDDETDTEKLEELLKQIQAKDAELVGEKGKNKDLVQAYKRLKHQYTYLCEKCGLTSGNMLPQAKLEDAGDLFKHPKSPTVSPELRTKDLNTSPFPQQPKKVKIEDGINDVVETDNPWKTVSNPSFHLPPPRPAARKLPPPTAKSPSIISGVKRPASGWVETRSAAQGKNGPDPHDDFLSTPLENLRANRNKAIIIMEEEEANLFADVVPAKADVIPRGDNDSDDETQNMNVDPRPAKRDHLTLPEGKKKKGFKYVETVRKKADREKLQGVECKQCKKFYDAVLEKGGGGGGNENLRCEHHDGVSRHRYRYAPPMTPEGFWNIGFESEM